MSEQAKADAGTQSGSGGDRAEWYRNAIDLFRRVGTLAASNEGAGQAMRELLSGVSGLLGGAMGSIMLVDSHIPNTMTIRHATGLPEEVIQRTRVRIGRGVAGTVAETGEPILLRAGERHPGSEQRAEGAYSSAICVPLKVRDELIGVLNVRQANEGEEFTEEHLVFLQAVAGLAAPSIELARMIDTLHERVEDALGELSRSNVLLRQAREQLERVLESAPSPALVLDDSHVLMLLNRAAEDLLGRSRTELQFQRLQDVVVDTDFGQALLDALSNFERGEPMLRLTLGDPIRKAYQPHIAPLGGDTGPGGYVVILADITELEELSQLKSDLVSMTSHELRSPLTSIKGAAMTLVKMHDLLDDKTRQELAALVVSEADRLNAMVTNLLDISRIESGRALDLVYKAVDIGALVERVVMTNRSQTASHELIVDLAPELPEIQADGGKIEQVLINLVSNAIKYAPGGGVIRVSAYREGDRIKLSVIDQGLGISDQDLPKVFQRYRRVGGRLAKSAIGTGLGLYLSKGFVEAHGGTIEVMSRLGEGSTFTMALPMAPPDDS